MKTKRRATLVIEILRRQTTVAEAARTHGLKVSVLSTWVNFYNTKRPHQALGYLSPAQRRATQQLPKVS